MKLRLDSLYGPVGTSSIRRHVGHHGTILVQICGVMRKRKYEQKQLEEKKKFIALICSGWDVHVYKKKCKPRHVRVIEGASTIESSSIESSSIVHACAAHRVCFHYAIICHYKFTFRTSDIITHLWCGFSMEATVTVRVAIILAAAPRIKKKTLLQGRSRI